MSEKKSAPAIRLRGVRHNNLKNFDLDLPLHRFIVITGLSGSGKSSLAFDTLYAEGQRRYIETFSPYARQFFDRMDKPQADSVEGIPPAIAIEQRNAVRSTRSTVGTMTEICEHMKVLWPHLSQLHCRGCAKPVHADPPQRVWEKVSTQFPAANGVRQELLVTFNLPLSDKLPLAESLGLISKQGYQRLLLDGAMVRIDDLLQQGALKSPPPALTVIQDRVPLAPANRARFVEACEQAYHFGKGKLTLFEIQPPATLRNPQAFSNKLHCAECDIEYAPASAALFSFNHPLGACPTCKGFGRTITIDYDLAIPDRTLTLAQGAVKPWRTGFSADCQSDLKKFCKAQDVPMNVPFHQMSAAHQKLVIQGEPDYGKDEEHQWPRAWYGVKGYFRWLESKSYKMHVRVLLSRYRAYTKCPDCQGARLKPDALLYLLRREPDAPTKPAPLALPDFYALPVRDALQLVETVTATRLAKVQRKQQDPIAHALEEVRARLAYLDEVGLGYLTLDRPTRTLSGGETERVNLTTCLGTRLVNTLFVLDEPSVGLHPRDTDRLVAILEKLRDTGNTVIVVEHEANVMRAADQIVDIGPGHGATGGEVVFQGPLPDLLQSTRSLTGQYLSGRKQIPLPARRVVDAKTPALRITNATRHNLQNVSVEIPLGRLVAITGVSGSGKSTLIRDVVLPALQSKLQGLELATAKASDRMDAESDSSADETPTSFQPTACSLTGHETLGAVVLVDQSSLGKTPRSNPAVYIGAFDDIRDVFVQSEAAARRGLNSSAFSFNSGVGQCEKCRGAGFEKIEMQFLSDIFIRCPECNGRRYRPHILEVKIAGKNSPREFSIGDMLEATVDEAIEFLAGFTDSKPALRAINSLKLLQEVGLGYLRLGQPINTLSGGESQRLKLVRHLAEATSTEPSYPASSELPRPLGEEGRGEGARRDQGTPVHGNHTLFLFDEPTTGLHFDDVRVLLQVFQRLVAAGHSVLVIEHNLDVIKCADWVIDLGPEAGDRGGAVVATGTPEQVATVEASATGRYLKAVLKSASRKQVGAAK